MTRENVKITSRRNDSSYLAIIYDNVRVTYNVCYMQRLLLRQLDDLRKHKIFSEPH